MVKGSGLQSAQSLSKPVPHGHACHAVGMTYSLICSCDYSTCGSDIQTHQQDPVFALSEPCRCMCRSTLRVVVSCSQSLEKQFHEISISWYRCSSRPLGRFRLIAYTEVRQGLGFDTKIPGYENSLSLEHNSFGPVCNPTLSEWQ